MNDLIKYIEAQYTKDDVPVFNIGDTVKVSILIKEGNKERTQIYEGTVIKRQNGGVRETFTVRRIAYGVGTEKTFLLHSPKVLKIEVVRRGKVRRAKLYYLRDKVGKKARLVERLGVKIPKHSDLIKSEEPAKEESAEETTTTENN